MKLKGSALVVVAMMIGSLAVTGCRRDDGGSETPEENPDTAPAETAAAAAPAANGAATPAAAPDTENNAFWAPHAPPAVRVEVQGVAPSPRHVWAGGYWGWRGRQYHWYPGRWIVRREGYTWWGPRWEHHGGRYSYHRGYWRR